MRPKRESLSLGGRRKLGLDGVDDGTTPVLVISPEVELLQRQILAVAQVDRLAHLAIAALAEPAEADEAEIDLASAADQVDGLRDLFEIVGARAFQHVGAELLGERHIALLERLAQRDRQRFAGVLRPVLPEQRVGERATRDGLLDDERLIGIFLDQLLEGLHQRGSAFELLELGRRLEVLGLLVSALRPVRQRVLCLLQDALGLGEIAEAGLGPHLFEPRKQPQALGLLGEFAANLSALAFASACSPIRLRAWQRLMRMRFASSSGRGSGSSGSSSEAGPANRLRSLATLAKRCASSSMRPNSAMILAISSSIVLKTGEGESGKQLARRLAIVAAPGVHDGRLAPNLDQLVEIRRRRRFGLCLCLGEMLQRLAVELPPVQHDSHEPMRARLMLRIVRERRQDSFQPRLEVREIPASLLDLGFDRVEIGLDVLRFSHHRLGSARPLH